jgi:hypothetical protein
MVTLGLKAAVVKLTADRRIIFPSEHCCGRASYVEYGCPVINRSTLNMTTVPENPSTESVGDDLDKPLWGAAAIGAEIDKTTSQTFHLLEAGHLPATKVGRQWVSTKRRLRQCFAGTA